MQISYADYLVHLSNFLLLISYSVRDILWLRWFAVAAAFIVMPYYLAQSTVLWPPVAWGGVFAAINLYQIALIYWERRPVQLNAEEQALYDMAFRSIRPRDFVSLLMVGSGRMPNRAIGFWQPARRPTPSVLRSPVTWKFGRGRR